jgi:hypothetical protein
VSAASGEPEQRASRGSVRSSDSTRSRQARSLFIAATVIAIVPVVVATIRAIATHWVPISDNAYFGIRPWDVFTQHPPLLGTWTSASLSVGTNINNPGPLFFDVLAPAVRIFGPINGPAIGTALLNIAAIVGIALVAYRRGGAVLGTAAMMLTAALAWSMGNELLFDPWQPHSMVLPFLAFLMCAWALSCGDIVMLPWGLAIGSLLVQTHLTFVYLVTLLSIWAVVASVITHRRDRADARAPAAPAPKGAAPGPAAPSDPVRPRLKIVLAITLVVFVVCWAQPVWEELTGVGEGNITRLVKTAGNSGAESIGLDRGARLVSTVLTAPPFWLRPSFNDAFTPAAGGAKAGPGGIGVADLPSIGVTALCFLGLALVLALCAWDARRRRDRDALRALVTAGLGILAGLYTAGQIPQSVFGVAPHQFRWLWPVSAFTTFAILITVVGAVLRRTENRSRPGLTVGFLAVTALVALLTIPNYDTNSGPNYQADAMPVQRDLNRQLAKAKIDGPLLYDYGGITFAEPYSVAIMSELQQKGIPFVVNVPYLVRQLGPSRGYNGHNAKQRIFYRWGDEARDPQPGGRKVAVHHALNPKDDRELTRLKTQILEALQGGQLFTESGQDAITAKKYPVLHRVLEGESPPEQGIKFRELFDVVDHDLDALRPEWRKPVRRYVDLQRRFDREEVVVWVAPLGQPAPAVPDPTE